MRLGTCERAKSIERACTVEGIKPGEGVNSDITVVSTTITTNIEMRPQSVPDLLPGIVLIRTLSKERHIIPISRLF